MARRPEITPAPDPADPADSSEPAGRARFVGLLRGINVGGAAKVAMADLRQAAAEMGLAEVSTYINSGNLLFSSGQHDEVELGRRLTAALTEAFGFPLAVTVRSQDRLHQLLAAIPPDWTNDKVHQCHVVFAFPEAGDVLSQVVARPGIDEVRAAADAVAWRVARANQSRSGLLAMMGTPLYRQVTLRNINTVRKLATLL